VDITETNRRIAEQFNEAFAHRPASVLFIIAR
jgi:hypothetical protein